MVSSSRKAGLGRTLCKAQRVASRRRNPRKSAKHNVDTNPNQDNSRLNLKSVTAQTNLDEFFEEAELAGKQFVTERRNMTIVNDENRAIDLYSQHEKADKIPEPDDDEIESSLSVPRRPKWDSHTTPEQLDEMERFGFLAWRRKLAKIQECDKFLLTPFEKNLEVWRQLWRVVERSDIVVQILDCRNPLLYICDDLIIYVDQEFGGKKMNMILLNKADYLSRDQRRMWYDYFHNLGIKSIFFSALIENENLKKTSDKSDEEPANDEQSSDSETDDDGQHSDLEPSSTDEEQIVDKTHCLKLTNDIIDDATRVYNKFELLDFWHDLLCDLRENNETSLETDTKSKSSVCSNDYATTPLTVGLVGYPNVGKSSTINALLSAKRVAVSATPGKTKHFQTFLVDKNMMLCDCPGLVFPNFISNKSEMVVNGILPIDQMRDHLNPVRIIVSRIPRVFFEEIYGIAFVKSPEQNITAEDLLNAFGFMRGYMTSRGLPDTSRAARKICKDYINGKILYCEPPPNVDKKLFQSKSKLAKVMQELQEKAVDPNQQSLRITERQRRLMNQARGAGISSQEFDAQYFGAKSCGYHVKQLPGIGRNMNITNGAQPEVEVYDELVRPIKRDKGHKKREKLRRIYRDLDI